MRAVMLICLLLLLLPGFTALIQIIGEEQGLEFLDRLHDPDVKARQRAEAALTHNFPRFQHPELFTDRLLAGLRSDHADARRCVTACLGYCRPERAVGPVLRMLDDPDLEVRQAAVGALGNLRDPRALEPLLKALGDEKMRQTAAIALGKLGDPRAAEPILNALPGSSWQARPLLQALEMLGPPARPALVKALAAQQAEIRAGAAALLGNTHDPACLPPLLPLLNDADSRVRTTAIEALGNLGDGRAAGPLLEAMADAKYADRWAIPKALGQLQDPRAVPPLIAHMRDPMLASGAADALGLLRDERAVPALIELLADMEGTGVPAARALGRSLDPRAVEPLATALKNPSSAVREAAATALLNFRDPAAAAALIAALGDESPKVRRTAAQALGLLREKRAVAPLAARLADPDATVRAAAATALGQIGGAEIVTPLATVLEDKSFDVRQATFDALGTAGAPALDVLLAALGNPDRGVRTLALRSLGRLHDARAVVPLLRAAPWRLPGGIDTTLQLRAVEALAEIGVPAVEPLIAALDDPEAGLTAVQALSLIGDPRAAGPVLAAMERHPGLRAVGMEALGGPPTVEADRRIVAALAGGDRLLAYPAVKACARRPVSGSLEPLLDLLRTTQDTSIRNEAMRALGQWPDDPRVFAALAAAIQQHPYQARVAAEALGRTRDPRALPALLPLLDHAREEVRGQAAAAILTIPAPRIVEPVAGLLAARKTRVDVSRLRPEVLDVLADPRLAPACLALLKDGVSAGFAAGILARLREERAVPLLIDAARHHNPDVREPAVLALGVFGPDNAPTALPVLLAALGDEVPAVRQSALKALTAWQDDPRVTPQLTVSLRDPDPPTAALAYTILQAITGQ